VFYNLSAISVKSLKPDLLSKDILAFIKFSLADNKKILLQNTFATGFFIGLKTN